MLRRRSLSTADAQVVRGYSKKTAAAAAARLLTNVNVQPLLEAAMKARFRRTQVVDSDWFLKRLHDEAEADLAGIYENNGRLKPGSRMARDLASRSRDGRRCDNVDDRRRGQLDNYDHHKGACGEALIGG